MSDDGGQPSRADGLSVLGVTNVLLRRRRQIVWCAVAVGMIGGLSALAGPRTFTSEASFVHEEDESARVTQGIAEQVGIAAGSGLGQRSLAFHAELLQSREVLGRVVDRKFVVPEEEDEESEGREGTWAGIFELEGGDSAQVRDQAIRSVRGRIDVDVAYDTGMVTLGVSTPWPTVSRDAVAALVDVVNEFNLEQRQSRASARREFVSERLEGTRQELREAEEDLEAFLNQNRQIEGSPTLMFEADRLEREVGYRQQIVTTLTQSYEEARIDEVRSTPIITPVVQPYLPMDPDGRGVVLRTALGVMAGLLLGMLIAMGREALRVAAGTQDRDGREFARLRTELKAELRNPLRFLVPGRAGDDGMAENGVETDDNHSREARAAGPSVKVRREEKV